MHQFLQLPVILLPDSTKQSLARSPGSIALAPPLMAQGLPVPATSPAGPDRPSGPHHPRSAGGSSAVSDAPGRARPVPQPSARPGGPGPGPAAPAPLTILGAARGYHGQLRHTHPRADVPALREGQAMGPAHERTAHAY